MKRLYTKEEGDIGIATLILFIAIIIVAAIASSLIIYVGVTLREQGEKVADEAVEQITSAVRILNILGDRDVDGMAPNIISVRAPITADHSAPQGGLIKNVSVYSNDPLDVKITWCSAVDTASGMGKEEIYRVSGDYTTLKYVLSNIDYVKTMGTLIASFNSNFTDNRVFIDYGVESGVTYGYAIIGYDRAGNYALYDAINQTVSISSGTRDTAPPSGTINSIKVAGVGVLLSWSASDSGSGIKVQKIYRSNESIDSANLDNATLVAVLSGAARSYIDYPPKQGTWYYAIVGVDNAGNNATYSATVDHVELSTVDKIAPSDIGSLHESVTDYKIQLSWDPASDNGSGINSYYIYRSKDYSALTTPELFKSKPYAMVNTTHFDDYSYISYQTYYYAVVPVDNAGNFGVLVYPQNSIQVLEIKLALGPGSKPVDFNDVILEITDGSVDASLKLNSTGFGLNCSDSEHYSMEVLNDPTGEFRQSYILDDGAVVLMYINAQKVGLNLVSQTTVKMKIILGSGIPVYKELIIPSTMLNRYVQIY